MNSHEIHSNQDIRGRREEGQDYVEDGVDVREMDTRRGQDYLDEDDGSGILNKVMDSKEFGESESA